MIVVVVCFVVAAVVVVHTIFFVHDMVTFAALLVALAAQGMLAPKKHIGLIQNSPYYQRKEIYHEQFLQLGRPCFVVSCSFSACTE